MSRDVHPYWRIFAEEVPCELGIDLTDEQVNLLAKAVEGAVENQSLACGWDKIPNPDRSEITRLEKQIKDMRLEADEAEDVWRDAMAHIGGVRASELYRDGKRIKVAGYCR